MRNYYENGGVYDNDEFEKNLSRRSETATYLRNAGYERNSSGGWNRSGDILTHYINEDGSVSYRL